MTTQPCAPILGDHSLEILPPADMRQISVSEKSKVSSALTLSVLSPKDTSVPCDRRDASATTSLTGKPRSSSIVSISRPTLPVAPTTATLKLICVSPVPLSCSETRWPLRVFSPGPDPGGGEQAKGN